MTERIHLSWSRDDEGVITIYATDENTGRIAEVADFWTKPMRERLGFRREYAKGVQQQLAETLVWNWNGPPGGAGDCHVAVAPEPETERLQKALADLLNRVEAHGCEKWFPHVVERARAALEAVMPEGEPAAYIIWRPGLGYRVELVGRPGAELLAGDDGTIAPLYEHPAPEPGEVERLQEAARKARAVLAQAVSAGWNAGGPTPEDTEAAFWSLDAALAEGGGE